jgi:uncharacterized protein
MKKMNARCVTLLILFLNACNGSAQIHKVNSETITFKNPALGFQAEISGLLQWPANQAKHPLVVFIHGAGRGTRFEYSNLFSEFLNHGYAVFSYDKRGVEGSGGEYNGVGPKNSPMMIPLLASDAYEAIESIRHRPEIDSTKILLIGASQAGWIIPVVATMNTWVSHYIILYGPTVSVGEEIYYSRFAEDHSHTISDAEDQMKRYTGLKGFIPMPYISELTQKGLWIFGGQDESIPTARSIQLLDSLNHGSEKPYTIKLYPQASHGLLNKVTGQFENYIPFMFDWLKKNGM